METLELCGLNGNFGIGEKSNNTNVYGKSIIYPPIISDIKVSTISSYSTYTCRTIIVTKDGVAQGIGDNSDGQISCSLPKEIINHFMKIDIRDDNNNPCKTISAVCGKDYTLFMVSNNDKTQLAYSYLRMNSPFPIILNTENYNPIALYGGHSDCCAIDSEGGIIYIDQTIIENPTKKIERIFLPSGEKTVSVAWCYDSVFALGLSGHVYESKIGLNLSFNEVSEFNGNEIVSISGVCQHIIAVSKDGCAFVRGDNFCGQLGLRKTTFSVINFFEISSLHKFKIVAAYAGFSHSLFQTSEGKLLACGNNCNGQLLLSCGPSKDEISDPTETIMKNVSFCVAGNGTTAIFKNYVPPMNPNKRVNIENNTNSEMKQEKANNENLSKDEEILRLKEKIASLEKLLALKEKEYTEKLALKEKEFNEKLSLKDKEIRELNNAKNDQK